MRAFVLTGHGGLDMLDLRDDVAVPVPTAGEVLVQVAAAAVNNTDIWSRQGAYGRPGDPDAVAGWRGVPLDTPLVQGGDVTGRIVAVGDGVDRDRIGQRVVVDPAIYDADDPNASVGAVLGSERDGGFAEYVAVDHDCAHDVSDSPLPDEQLACLPIAYGTAMGMLERAELRDGETVCVTGASGGVGLALVQLAIARGARVVAVTSDSGANAVASAGASEIVLRTRDDVGEAVRKAAGGGVDCLADVVGGALFGPLFDTLRVGGRAVIAGAIAGPVIELDLRQLYLHQRRLIGSTMHTPAHFAKLADLARQGTVAPAIAERFPLAKLRDAQERFVAGGFVGKLVVVP